MYYIMKHTNMGIWKCKCLFLKFNGWWFLGNFWHIYSQFFTSHFKKLSGIKTICIMKTTLQYRESRRRICLNVEIFRNGHLASSIIESVWGMRYLGIRCSTIFKKRHTHDSLIERKHSFVIFRQFWIFPDFKVTNSIW